MGKFRGELVVMVTTIRRLPERVTMYKTKNTTNTIFCIWGFFVRTTRMNTVTFLSFSIYVVWLIKTLARKTLPLKKKERKREYKKMNYYKILPFNSTPTISQMIPSFPPNYELIHQNFS